VLREAVESARGQQGALVLVEGTAGIGKSALLERGAELGRSMKVRVLAACGGELERDFPFGVVRQLFEPVLRGVAGRRRELFSGAAGLAAPLLLPESAGEAAWRSSGDSLFPVLHGLYWLTANLADREPLLIVIDDLHWVDSPSLRFVLFAARRLRGLPVALVTAVRTGEPGVEGDLLARLAAERDARMVRLGALSQGAVARLVGGRSEARRRSVSCARAERPPVGSPFCLQSCFPR
jgi:predicted ATPase